jgi:hypothetical protein
MEYGTGAQEQEVKKSEEYERKTLTIRTIIHEQGVQYLVFT